MNRNLSEQKEHFNTCNGTESILESLYELWINQDPAYDEHVRQLYGQLGEWVDKMSTREADRMTGIIVDLCIAYSRKGFLDGARLGGLLVQELLLGKQVL